MRVLTGYVDEREVEDVVAAAEEGALASSAPLEDARVSAIFFDILKCSPSDFRCRRTDSSELSSPSADPRNDTNSS